MKCVLCARKTRTTTTKATTATVATTCGRETKLAPLEERIIPRELVAALRFVV